MKFLMLVWYSSACYSHLENKPANGSFLFLSIPNLLSLMLTFEQMINLFQGFYRERHLSSASSSIYPMVTVARVRPGWSQELRLGLQHAHQDSYAQERLYGNN